MKFNLGMNVFTPVLDRFSSLSYSIANHIHYEVAKHTGVESCFRVSLGICSIIQGFGLFKELSEECVRCAKIRHKYLEASMGPLSDHQLTLSPPFWITMLDLFGPLDVYVPGFEKETRNRRVLKAKV